jgi:hypothetical protein
MTLRPKWLRDICAPLFSLYYIIYANEAEERVSYLRFRIRMIKMLRIDLAPTLSCSSDGRAIAYYLGKKHQPIRQHKYSPLTRVNN